MVDIVKEKIVGDVKDGGYFYAISADEVRDVSNKEQLAVCIRFPDKSDSIREEFLTFVDVSSDTSGERLSEEILGVLDSVDLDKHQMRGQCYDGAGNMTGKVKGVGPRIQRQYPRALPFWCTAHQLNRCVVHACDNKLVRNMMGTVHKV
ncbi:zinc finger MYM-type protein 1-like [Ruditapes philippinarum]|uniref:zinc finger MYM-type protein 1-like n=1 Tax=Ruditapes philippinarum TaxID=129788 RepID=UPI00295A5F04|nr:zinc finger MYM-type protein 1-like [Ruditapes philippinarum]